MQQSKVIYKDVLVIGGGQAGLAAGYYLQQRGISFLILDKGEAVGEVWRNRYDSLVLFTPRWYSALPGMPLNGDPDGYAAKEEIADYLAGYASRFALPIQHKTAVLSLEQTRDSFLVETNRGLYAAKRVIVATGPFQTPIIPAFADQVPDDVYQVHTSSYLNASQLREGNVLVVGAGNSGAQIAAELARDREVVLSVGHAMRFMPLEIAGKSIFWWFRKFGLLRANVNSVFGRLLQKQGDPVFGLELRNLIRQGQVKLKPRTVGMTSNRVLFQDGTGMEISNIVWATGFRNEYSWIRIPDAFDAHGKPIHQRGRSVVSGLYFAGLPWQYRRGSALLGGVGDDAEILVNRIGE